MDYEASAKGIAWHGIDLMKHGITMAHSLHPAGQSARIGKLVACLSQLLDYSELVESQIVKANFLLEPRLPFARSNIAGKPRELVAHFFTHDMQQIVLDDTKIPAMFLVSVHAFACSCPSSLNQIFHFKIFSKFSNQSRSHDRRSAVGAMFCARAAREQSRSVFLFDVFKYHPTALMTSRAYRAK